MLPPHQRLVAARKTAPRTAAAAVFTAERPAGREKWMFSTSGNVFFLQAVAFLAAKLPPPARLGTIFPAKIVPNRDRTRFRPGKPSPTGIGRDFGRENHPQPEKDAISAAEIVPNWSPATGPRP